MALMSTTVMLTWGYSPPTYFEGPLLCSIGGYTLTIADGTVEATVDTSEYDQRPTDICRLLHRAMIILFRAEELIHHTPYDLSEAPMVTRLRSDGSRCIEVTITGVAAAARCGMADIRVTNMAGHIVHESRRERLNKTTDFVNRFVRFSNDVTLGNILDSFDSAMRSPDTELVHLYEIRDALKRRFGGADAAKTTLHLSDEIWKTLGTLANREPIRQSRHRGLHGRLRDATRNELDKARESATSMIEAYLDYLDPPQTRSDRS